MTFKELRKLVASQTTEELEDQSNTNVLLGHNHDR